MRLLAFIEFLRGRLPIVIRVCLGVLAALVVVDAIPGLVHKEGHAHTWVESHLPGFWAAFGFLGCVVIILASKAFGHSGVMKREDYYDE